VPLGLLNVAFALLSLLLAGLNGYSLTRYFEGYTLPASILAISYSVVGALVASHRPRNPLGWIFLAVGFSQGSSSSRQLMPSTRW
jgi:two-component system NarL family sensor kinase